MSPTVAPRLECALSPQGTARIRKLFANCRIGLFSDHHFRCSDRREMSLLCFQWANVLIFSRSTCRLSFVAFLVPAARCLDFREIQNLCLLVRPLRKLLQYIDLLLAVRRLSLTNVVFWRKCSVKRRSRRGGSAKGTWGCPRTHPEKVREQALISGNKGRYIEVSIIASGRFSDQTNPKETTPVFGLRSLVSAGATTGSGLN